MSKMIMVPLDGSHLAEVALPCVEEICGKLSSEVIVIGVRWTMTEQSKHIYQRYLDQTAEDMENRIVEHYSIPKSKVKVNAAMLNGHPAREIVDYAKSNDIDLIVMATHGYSGIERWALGGVTDKVIRESSKPVLVIRAKDDKATVRQQDICTKVVIPLDGSGLAEAALPVAEALLGGLALHNGIEANLMCVLEQLPNQKRMPIGMDSPPHPIPEEERLQLNKSIKHRGEMARRYLYKASRGLFKAGVKVDCEVRFGDAAAEIIKYADEIGAGTVIMSTHGLSGINRWMLGSVSDKVLRMGNTAVLLVSPSSLLGVARR